MDGFACIRGYIDRMLCNDDCTGMKVLMLDGSTTQIVSCVYSQTEILQNEVYLVSRLDDPVLLGADGVDGDIRKQRQHVQHLQQQQIEDNNDSDSTSHLKAIIFVRPTEMNIGLLLRELQSPRYSEYYVYFSAIVTSGHIRLLAEADIYERVQKIQEYYADFVPINKDLCTLQCRNTLPMTVAAGTSWAQQHAHLYERNLQGLQSMLLALKRSPYAIRYAGNSFCAQQLANDIANSIQQDDIFHFRQSRPSSFRSLTSSSRQTFSTHQHSKSSYSHHNASEDDQSRSDGGLLLLILDRRDDPVTPLLSQWTYQAMVHELLGLNNHRVILRGAPNVPKHLEEVVLDGGPIDTFFSNNKHKNYGQLCEEIQRYLQDYQKKANTSNMVSNLNSIQEMQQFMEKFPELRSQSHNVSKHVAIIGELARLVEVCSLMDVSQFEQELACNDDHNNHWNELMDKLLSDHVKIPDKLRLGLLYALRYENTNQNNSNANSGGGSIPQMLNIMSKGGVPQEYINLVEIMLRYAGTKSRGPGLYGEHESALTKITKTFMTNVQGISNVYAQHEPLLMDVINSIIKGRLRGDHYPFCKSYDSSTVLQQQQQQSHSSHYQQQQQQDSTRIPKEILVFMVGGITYEEGTKISEFNQTQIERTSSKQNDGSSSILGRSNSSSRSDVNDRAIRVLLGGSTIHNSTSFLEELRATF